MYLPDNGFYVDIGAYSPTECSNTHAFYNHGWNGINIDATPGVMGSFDLLRKRDINLNIAIGSESKELTFYSWGALMFLILLTRNWHNRGRKVLVRNPMK